MTEPLQILVVDDHDIVRAGVVAYINGHHDFAVVGEASDHAGAVDAAARLAPDVVILDVRLGHDSGIEVCRDLKTANPDIAVVMFTSFADGEALESAMLAGANAYVLKRISLDDLSSTIRRVARGETMLDADASEVLTQRLAGNDSADPRLAKLSPQERNVLKLIAQGRTNRQIAEELALAEKTVKNYVSNLLRKLDMRRRSEAAAFRASIDPD
ncbi:MAG: response regulator transcription factor [Acidimicrobiia bacterium]|nr:response regulator transcription factor [Acidimicrobiia bacterium]